MIQSNDGSRLAGTCLIASAAACAALLSACSQTASPTANTEAVAGAPTRNSDMEEVVITASRQTDHTG
jgi:hypothetical protein